MKNKKFKDEWKTQTQIGELFNLTSIKVGKILIDNNLKNKTTNLASDFAIEHGFAKQCSLKNGKIFFMWNLDKICSLINKTHEKLSKKQLELNKIKNTISYANEKYNSDSGLSQKLAMFAYDELYDTYSEEFIEIVKFDLDNYGIDDKNIIELIKKINTEKYFDINKCLIAIKDYYPHLAEKAEVLLTYI